MTRRLKRGVENDAGVFNARKGIYNGKEYIFTHRSPKTGYLWCENFPIHTWINPEKVILL